MENYIFVFVFVVAAAVVAAAAAVVVVAAAVNGVVLVIVVLHQVLKLDCDAWALRREDSLGSWLEKLLVASYIFDQGQVLRAVGSTNVLNLALDSG